MNQLLNVFLSHADLGCIYYFIIYCFGSGIILFLLCFLQVLSYICLVAL